MTTIRPLDIRRALKSFDLALRAENKSPGTVGLYSLAVRQFTGYLETEGHSFQVGDITRDEINGYLSGLHRLWKPSTVHTRYRGLQAFFKFLTQEGEILESPMRNMRPPRLPEILVPVLSEDDIKTLLKTCIGNSFEDRRDLALIRLFVSTGARRGELINLRFVPEVPEENDISLDPPTVRVIGKGNRERIVPFDMRTAQAIDRYLRLREVHNHAYMPWLWLARKGRLSPTGVLQMIRRRARRRPRSGKRSPTASHVCPSLAFGRRKRVRPHATRRLAKPDHDRPLRTVRGGRTRHGRHEEVRAREPHLIVFGWISSLTPRIERDTQGPYFYRYAGCRETT